MSSQARKESSRRNGKKSKGPKSDEGRQRSSRNSLSHGLSLPVSADPQLSSQAERLAELIAGADASEGRMHEARIIAEAQMELQRVRRLRLERLAQPSLVKKPVTLKSLRGMIKLVEANIADDWEQMDIVERFEQDLLPEVEGPLEQKIEAVIRSFSKLDRYERRALSKRKFAIRRLVGGG